MLKGGRGRERDLSVFQLLDFKSSLMGSHNVIFESVELLVGEGSWTRTIY